MFHQVGGPMFWAVVYAGVLGAAALRRWRQSRAPFRQGTAGWDEDPVVGRPWFAGGPGWVAYDLAVCAVSPFILAGEWLETH